MRLDQYLAEKALAPSRARAQELIRAGLVSVNGAPATKSSMKVAASDEVTITGAVHDYVSRGALKLVRGLELIDASPEGRVCLDLGASTGGFTEVLLRRGAAKVYAVDVGHGQLHPRVAGDSRVVNLEKTHARELAPAIVPDPIELLVCDVSFISLRKALLPALALCEAGASCVALIKPQFELGPAHIGRGGLVRASDDQLQQLCQEIADWFAGQGWEVTGIADSPIEGGDGNREYLIGAVRKT